MGVTIVADQGVSQFYLEKCVMIHERFENLVISVSTYPGWTWFTTMSFRASESISRWWILIVVFMIVVMMMSVVLKVMMWLMMFTKSTESISHSQRSSTSVHSDDDADLYDGCHDDDDVLNVVDEDVLDVDEDVDGVEYLLSALQPIFDTT